MEVRIQVKGRLRVVNLPTAEPRKPVWRTWQPSEVVSVEPAFWGEALTGNPAKDPVSYFNEQLDDNMKVNFVTQSNLFSVQKDPNKPLGIKMP